MRSLFILVIVTASACGSSEEPELPEGKPLVCEAPITPTPSTVSAAGVVRFGEAEAYDQDGPDYNHSTWGELASDFRPGGTRFLGTWPQWSVETTTQAGCTLHRYQAAFCNPGCSFEEVCNSGVCEPFPATISAGEIGIGGAQAVVRTPPPPDPFSGRADSPLPLFQTGDPILACATGGVLPAFQATLPAPAPLGIDLPKEGLDFTAGTPRTFEWAPAGDESTIRFELVNSNLSHGAPAELVIVCEASDADGEITVPAELVDMLVGIEGSNPPSGLCAGNDCLLSTISRVNRTTITAGEMTVDYEVFRERHLWNY